MALRSEDIIVVTEDPVVLVKEQIEVLQRFRQEERGHRVFDLVRAHVAHGRVATRRVCEPLNRLEHVRNRFGRRLLGDVT